MWNDIAHFGIPAGPNGPTPPYFVPFSHGLMKYSKNQKAAKDFLKWLHSQGDIREVVRGRERLQRGRHHRLGEPARCGTRWTTPLKAFRVAARGSRMIGHAGPATAKATEVYTKYIITDIFAKAVQGMSPEDAVKWGERS